MVSAGDVSRLADHCAMNARSEEDRAGDGIGVDLGEEWEIAEKLKKQYSNVDVD
jgi:hypothetical protein